MDGQHPDIALLCALSDAERAPALERYSVLQPSVEHGVPLTHVARHHRLPLRTVQRWLAGYRHAGLVGLARHGQSDRGQQRALRAELKPLIEGFALRRPPPTVAFVHSQVCAVALQHGWPVPTYQSVYRVVKHLDPGLLTLRHKSTTAYRTTFDLLYRREAYTSNEIWQAGHALLDLWCGMTGPGGAPLADGHYGRL
jgi:putative transposase